MAETDGGWNHGGGGLVTTKGFGATCAIVFWPDLLQQISWLVKIKQILREHLQNCCCKISTLVNWPKMKVINIYECCVRLFTRKETCGVFSEYDKRNENKWYNSPTMASEVSGSFLGDTESTLCIFVSLNLLAITVPPVSRYYVYRSWSPNSSVWTKLRPWPLKLGRVLYWEQSHK